MAGSTASNRLARAKLRNRPVRSMRREHSDVGVIDGIVAMFAPFTALSKQLQAIFQLERPPAVRVEHGRLGILIRGTGVRARSSVTPKRSRPRRAEPVK